MNGDSPALTYALELAEEVIDAVAGSELMESIPFVAHAVKVLKAKDDINSRILAAKLTKFLEGTSRLDTQKWADRVREDSKQTRRIGETLLLVVDKANDLRKPSIAAALFCAFVEGKTTAEDFHRLMHVVDASFVPDLSSLVSIRGRGIMSGLPIRNYSPQVGSIMRRKQHSWSFFEAYGLVDTTEDITIKSRRNNRSKTQVRLTPLGSSFAGILEKLDLED